MLSRWRSSMRRLPSRATAPFGKGSPEASRGPLAASISTAGPVAFSPGGPAPPSPDTCGALDESLLRQPPSATTTRSPAILFQPILAQLLPKGGAVDAEHGGRPRLLSAARLEHAQDVA